MNHLRSKVQQALGDLQYAIINMQGHERQTGISEAQRTNMYNLTQKIYDDLMQVALPVRETLPVDSKIETVVRNIISEQLNVGIFDVHNHSTLASLGADSLDAVELAMSIEERFNIDIPDEEFDTINNVEQLIRYIEKQTRPSS